MKFDTDWVIRTAQCPDGAAWGLDFTKEAPKTLHEALAGFERADWLLWFMVKAQVIGLAVTLDFLLELAVKLAPAGFHRFDREELAMARTVFAEEAERLMVRGEHKTGHELIVSAFLCRLKLHVLDGDLDEALKDGQCVLNNLVAAGTGSLNFETDKARKAHGELCAWLRSHVIVSKGA